MPMDSAGKRYGNRYVFLFRFDGDAVCECSDSAHVLATFELPAG